MEYSHCENVSILHLTKTKQKIIQCQLSHAINGGFWADMNDCSAVELLQFLNVEKNFCPKCFKICTLFLSNKIQMTDTSESDTGKLFG